MLRQRMRRPMRGLGAVNTALPAAILSPAQIQSFAAAAGFAGDDLNTAVAIALAESFPSGNANSYNPESTAKGGTPTGQGSYGLWQIYLKAHPEDAGVNLFDPQTNANAAFAAYAAAGGFTPWTTYTSGAYQAYLPAGAAASGDSATSFRAGSSTDPGTDVTTVDDAGNVITVDSSSGNNDALLWGGAAIAAIVLVMALQD